MPGCEISTVGGRSLNHNVLRRYVKKLRTYAHHFYIALIPGKLDGMNQKGYKNLTDSYLCLKIHEWNSRKVASHWFTVQYCCLLYFYRWGSFSVLKKDSRQLRVRKNNIILKKCLFISVIIHWMSLRVGLRFILSSSRSPSRPTRRIFRLTLFEPVVPAYETWPKNSKIRRTALLWKMLSFFY